MQAARGYGHTSHVNGKMQSNVQVPINSSVVGFVTDTRAKQPADVPRAVATLLDVTKQLQEMLRLWSTHQVDEGQVSDVYVRIGTEFNATVTAFQHYNIDLSDLYSIPQELRTVLENCLSEEPSPQVFEMYMPQVRQIMYNLLQGLRGKQSAYWRAVGGRQTSQ
ncbi:hypothetical protein EWM64_g3430 [Hericium alpestre]|uniref:Aip3p/Bud6 N-terminal domain-containing protein n=1 Tax=Hericium alpestre TaxID=135208 RepID=A0A4Z0A0K1_9AGAM|nr:hypothetical protein EWM64_g3430 [Hericium alpestre]